MTSPRRRSRRLSRRSIRSASDWGFPPNPKKKATTPWGKFRPISTRPIRPSARRSGDFAAERGPSELFSRLLRSHPQASHRADFYRAIRKATSTAFTPSSSRSRRRSSWPRQSATRPRADLDQAELNLRYCDVVAEIDGVITRRNVNPGNNVQAGRGADGDPLAHRNLGRRQLQGDPIAPTCGSASRPTWKSTCTAATKRSRGDLGLHVWGPARRWPCCRPKRDGKLHQGGAAVAGAHRPDRLRPRQGSAVRRPLGGALRLVQGDADRGPRCRANCCDR